jgi:hypothetical protein
LLSLTACTALRPLDRPFLGISGGRPINAEGASFREVATLPLDLDEESSAAMVGFELGFGPGQDHQISEIGVEVVSESPPGQVRLAFHEDDDDDFFRPLYVFLPLDGGVARSLEASADCLGACEVPIATPRAGEVFVLRGFNFERRRGRSNLRRLAIVPDAGRRIVRVEFADNGALDYRVTLQYAYLDASAVAAQRHAAGARPEGTRRESIDLPREPGPALLQGFDFEFLNGDHRIGEISILHRPPGAPPAYVVRLNDQNTDDPYRAAVDYLILNP